MYQGDRPGLTDKMNLVAQRQRRSQGQLATDVVARSSYPDVGALVVGHGPGQPDPLLLGDEGSVLTSSPHDPGGMRWTPPLVNPSSGVGATAVLSAVKARGYSVGPQGELFDSALDSGLFVVEGDIDGRWFSAGGGGTRIDIEVDSVLALRLSASVEIRHSGSDLLPDRFCFAATSGAAPWGIPGFDSGPSVRPDLDSPIQQDGTWNAPPGDVFGYADWAHAADSVVVAAHAGAAFEILARFVSNTTSGTGAGIKMSLAVIRLGDPSIDTPTDLFF